MLYTKKQVGIPAIIILCAVEMGPDPLKLIDPIINANNYGGVHGLGRYTQSNETIISINDVTLNISPLDIINEEAKLMYDEFIVYDETKVSIRYIIIL